MHTAWREVCTLFLYRRNQGTLTQSVGSAQLTSLTNQLRLATFDIENIIDFFTRQATLMKRVTVLHLPCHNFWVPNSLQNGTKDKIFQPFYCFSLQSYQKSQIVIARSVGYAEKGFLQYRHQFAHQCNKYIEKNKEKTKMFFIPLKVWGLYYKHITIVIDTASVINK